MTKQEIQQLIEKYDDGMTTCAEENVLREYFRTLPDEEMPKEWQAYKMMFAFVDSKAAVVENPSVAKKSNGRLTLYMRIASIAACIAAAVIIALPKGNASDGYAVLDGKRVTNKHIVQEEAEAALQSVMYTDDDAFAAFDEL
ncbi:hypothetical protein E5358_07575 [Palleniella muris]|uniref:Uncharacterized protein n=1 Tax=Palleniella muris TaxID=3038145 RepID=A0AC61QQZ4_9BACT|nr:hypothetical protein [Palleniella muris]TGX82395.1 hypothetical protein E5358_07575 [Palleniella muris]